MMDTLAFKTYTSTLDCTVYGCKEPSEPHHLKAMGKDHGYYNKQHKKHLSVIPLCRVHHSEVGTIGVEKFEKKYHLNLWYECWRNLANWLMRGNG